MGFYWGKLQFSAFAVCLFLLGCGNSAQVPSLQPSRMMSDEGKLWKQGERAEALLRESGVIYENQVINEYLTGILERLQPSDTTKRRFLQTGIIKDFRLDAFALPHGAIFIHSGLLVRLENEAQLAALLAHEMIHCTHQHALRAFNRKEENRENLVNRKGLFFASGRYPDHFESEADLVGLQLITEAGYDPNEALGLLEILRNEVEIHHDIGSIQLDIHQSIQQRIENCRRSISRFNPEGGRGIKNKEIFLEKIYPVFLVNAELDLKAGEYESARKNIEKYLDRKYDDAFAYFLLGEIYRKKGGRGDIEKAKGFYLRSISMDSSYPDPHKAIGLIYYKKGEWRLARKSFEACLTLAPYHQDRAYIRGYLEKCEDMGV